MSVDINAIELAFEGHRDMLHSIFGKPGDKPKGPQTGKYQSADDVFLDPKNPPKDARGNPITLSPARFDAMFAKSDKLPPLRQKAAKGTEQWKAGVAIPVSTAPGAKKRVIGPTVTPVQPTK